jgi:hypothetical protein
MALGSRYPQGLIVVQNRDVDFRIARWQDVAKALGLAVDTAGYDVRPPMVPFSDALPHRVE